MSTQKEESAGNEMNPPDPSVERRQMKHVRDTVRQIDDVLYVEVTSVIDYLFTSALVYITNPDACKAVDSIAVRFKERMEQLGWKGPK
jgi:hypothetical protein